MKVTYNWLKDFVDIKLSPQVLADKLTMAGLEVKSIEEKSGDFIFEIEITSNRPDWLSVVGIAREVAAITGKKLIVPSAEKKKVLPRKAPEGCRIFIENKKDCPLYTARIIEDIKVGPAPSWLKQRLELVGCRSINNIVDITNYILFTWGQPLHAFDLERLGVLPAHIVVRRGRKGEEITTIDNTKRAVDENILLISCGQQKGVTKPVAIAGVMGGKDTEVVEGTRHLLLEAAAFNPVVVRRGRQLLGVQTESAYRFERGVDIQVVEDASQRAVALIQELAGGTNTSTVHSGLLKQKKTSISLEIETVQKTLGDSIPAQQIKSILQGLSFEVKAQSGNVFSVRAPSHRSDVQTAVDLIEEIARIYGYARIKTSVASVIQQPMTRTNREVIQQIKQILVALGTQEVITYSLVDKPALLQYGTKEEECVEIANPLSKEQAVLRTSLVPGLGRAVAFNLNQKQEYVPLFEIAKTYRRDPVGVKEGWVLGIVLAGRKNFWASEGRVQDEASLLHLKGTLETVCERLGINNLLLSARDNQTVEVSVNNEYAGVLWELSSEILDALQIKNNRVFAAEIMLEKILPLANLKKHFTAPPLYPSISRDISCVVSDAVSVDRMIKAIKEHASLLLKEVFISDYYKGKQIPPGYKGITISLRYRCDERTLIEDEITPFYAQAVGILKDSFSAQIR